jgi:glycosyltransferase involved in cell wall biosynthesis
VTRVAIVIPCLNEASFIGPCLQSCLAQEVEEGQLEIIVCDGDSRDATRAIVQDIMTAHPSVRLLENARGITPVALNLGIRDTKAEVIIILGAHSVIYPDYVKNCLQALHDHPDAGCVGGIIESEYSDEASEAIGLAQTSSFGVGNAYFRTGRAAGYVDTVAFGAYRREVFEKVGYFDEELIRNQDDEMNFRVLKNGYKILLDLSIRSRYFARASFRTLFRQYYQYGFWKVYANRKHRSITTLRQLVPFLFFSFLLFFPLTWLFFDSLLGYAAVVGLYLALAAISAASCRRGLSVSLKMVYAFLVLHLSYGFGYFRGILHFLVLNRRPPRHQAISR